MIVLNLGSGDRPVPFDVAEGGQVIDVDLDPATEPDVVADVRDLPFGDEYADIVFASHLIEHFDEAEIAGLLREWRRVLKTGGTLLIECPDIQAAATMIAANGVDSVLYKAINGADIRGQDVIFGWQAFIAAGGEPMRHKVAFDLPKLSRCLQDAGFVAGAVSQQRDIYSLFARVTK